IHNTTNHTRTSYIHTSVLSFFSQYSHNRDLPSFPTRRSSDLQGGRGDVCGTDVSLWNENVSGAPESGVSPSGTAGKENDDTERRAEEHTSELQSRFDLVCRLLLEKKKKEKRDRRRSRKEEQEK